MMRCASVFRPVVSCLVVASLLPTASAQTPTIAPEFLSATVEATPEGTSRRSSLKIDAEKVATFTYTAYTLAELIALAYQLEPQQVIGPSSLQNRYTIAARFPNATDPQVPRKMQSLLEQRFRLKLHRGHQEIDAYSMEVAEGGIKMKEARLTGPAIRRCGQNRDKSTGFDGPITCPSIDATEFRGLFQALVNEYGAGRPLLNRSGLEGVYDFRLDYASPKDAANGKPGPTFFEAAERQLGLKISPGRVAAEVLIVDSVASTPTLE